MSFYQRNKFLIWVLIAGFLFRVLILVFGSNLIPSFSGPDEITYDRIGWQIAQAWKGGESLNVVGQVSHIHIGYYYLVGSIYYLFGHYVILIQLLNIILGLGAAYLIYLLAKELFQERTAKISLALAAFWPSLAFWSTRNLKDILVIFLLVAIAFLFFKLTQRFKFSFLAVFLLSCFCLLTLRAYTLFLILGSLVLGRILAGVRSLGKKELILTGAVVCLLSGAFLVFQCFPDLEWNYFTKINLETLQKIRATTLTGGSSFLTNHDISTWSGVFKLLPPALVYSLFAPFPWQSGSLLFKIAIPETILWYLLFIFAIGGLVICWKKRIKDCLGIVLFMVFMTLALALFQGNIGTLFRQREQVWIFAFLFGALGIGSFLLSKNLFLKRAFDFSLSLISILLLLPLFFLISISIVLENGFSVFYLPKVVGFKGQKFRILKFRTMVVDRSKIPRSEYVPGKEDPRVTKVGRFLRRFSLDELPQLFNILRGEMSFVGPRPVLLYRMFKATEFEKRRLEVKPGLTGWQQVNGRNSLLWQEIITLDNWYVENFSFFLDLKIILKTFKVVLIGKGRNTDEKQFADVSDDFYTFCKIREKGQ